MLEKIDLRELVQINGNGRDFVSVYFSGREGIDSLKNREKTLRDLLADVPSEAEQFDLSMQLVRKLVEETAPETEGVCVFACALLEFVRGFRLPKPVSGGIYVGPAPHIRPLAELQDEYQTFAVVACSNDRTRIYLVTDEQAEVEEQIRGGVKNRVRKGGWSQKRYARRRENQLQHYADEVAQVIGDVVEREGISRIVLLGSEETMLEIEEQLSDGLREKIVGRERFDLHRSEDDLIGEAFKLYFEEEREEEQLLWDRIRNESMRHGLAALGPTDVLIAMEQGRADRLIVTRDAEIRGAQCRECESVVHGVPQTCQSCGSKSVFEVDLIDILTQKAQLTSASVEFSDEIPGLSRVKHVAALLRY